MKRFQKLFSLLLALFLTLGVCSAFAAKKNTITVKAAQYPVEETGWYSSMEEVAVYIATYGKLPGNYLTKNQAGDKGWSNSAGNLQKVAPGCSIGGDRFGNYEGQLPDGKWTECDIDYTGGYRNGQRIVFSKSTLQMFYTDDHYNTFREVIVDFTKDTPVATEAPVRTPIDPDTIDEYDEFLTVDEVAAYIHKFGKLPCNYLTKDEAKECGWTSKKDNLGEVMPGCAIGGDSFGNREGKLPVAEGREWFECDVNTVDGKRSDERICYSNDGLIFYTPDNHKTFEQLY